MFSFKFESAPNLQVSAAQSCTITPLTASKFNDAYLASPFVCSPPLSALRNSSNFKSTCSDILNSVGPLKARKPKTKTQPWLNTVTRSFRQGCRKAERKWKKDRLQVSYEIPRNCLRAYQQAVKAARASYFADIISRHSHSPKVLFETINSVLNPTPTASTSVTPDVFLSYFTKIDDIRSAISPPNYDPSAPCSATLCEFEPVPLTFIINLVIY